MKDKNPKSNNEHASSKPTNEGSMKKFKKKRIAYKCYYSNNGFPPNKQCFKKNMEIMSQLLEKHKIEVPDELEKHVDSSQHYHNAQFQGDITYSLSAIFLSFSHVSDIDLISDISESKISEFFLINLLPIY